MSTLRAIEIKAFIPAKDFAPSKRFYFTGIEQQPWCMRDFILADPSGVLWRIAQNTN